MAEQGSASRVFDFKKNPETAVGKAPGSLQNEVTYELFASDVEIADAAHPFLVLADTKGVLKHHVHGHFSNPHRSTTFAVLTDGKEIKEDVLKIDRRFLRFYEWIGENGITVRLSGKCENGCYSIYRIHAITPRKEGFVLAPDDPFIQMVIMRLLASRTPEEMSEDDDAEIDENEEIMLTSMKRLEDFLACAGDALPANVSSWAHRNVMLIKSGTVSPEERRHAQRALSMMLNIQWKGSYFESIDPVEARRILDEELYGLEKVKQRVIETIIQINRTHTLPAYGLLLAGPAGVGKSQIAYAVARILKLPWTSLDMSTIRNSEALTGSPRIYVNAKPGRIMEAFSQAGTSNLVFIINELDKADMNGMNGGNPADALLTLLDNLGYTDNYIECTIPTGGVYPIATANDKSKISEPLMTRFAVIDIPDYTPEEKKVIFTEFSLPKILKRMGMRKEECVIPADAVSTVVEKFADQPGVRDLEQAAEHLAANALYRIETQGVPGVVYTPEMVEKLLTT